MRKRVQRLGPRNHRSVRHQVVQPTKSPQQAVAINSILDRIAAGAIRNEDDMRQAAQDCTSTAQLIDTTIRQGDGVDGLRDLISLRAAVDGILEEPTPPQPAVAPPDLDKMSPQQCVEHIFQHGLEFQYQEHKPLFDKWWNALDLETQDRISAAADDFSSWEDYEFKFFSLPRHRPLALKLKQRVRRAIQQAFRRDAKAALEGDIDTPAQLDAAIEKIKDAFGLYFGTPTIGRPAQHEARDREFSKWNYEGMSWDKVADKHEERTHEALTKESVRRAATRSRENREPLIRALRVWIYETNYPPVHLNCVECGGRGMIQDAELRSWLEWIGQEPSRRREEPAKSGSPSLTCPACAGRGFCYPVLPGTTPAASPSHARCSVMVPTTTPGSSSGAAPASQPPLSA